MVTDASKTQRTVFSFLPVRDGPVLEGAFGFGILRAWAFVFARARERLISSTDCTQPTKRPSL